MVALAAVPAVGGDGDALVLGTRNTAKGVTRLNTRGGLRVDNFKPGNPALTLNVADTATPPMEVNSDAVVAYLNADLLDGRDAESFGTIVINESLNRGNNVLLATAAGAGITFRCTPDGAGGSTGVVQVKATDDGLHMYTRDPETMTAEYWWGWGAFNALENGEPEAFYTWDPDHTRNYWLESEIQVPFMPFIIWTPAGAVVEGTLFGLLADDLNGHDCVLSGYMIVAG